MPIARTIIHRAYCPGWFRARMRPCGRTKNAEMKPFSASSRMASTWCGMSSSGPTAGAPSSSTASTHRLAAPRKSPVVLVSVRF